MHVKHVAQEVFNTSLPLVLLKEVGDFSILSGE